MIVLAIPHGANAAAAIREARAGRLPDINLGAMTIDALSSLQLNRVTIVTGNKLAFDLLRGRHEILFLNESTE